MSRKDDNHKQNAGIIVNAARDEVFQVLLTIEEKGVGTKAVLHKHLQSCSDQRDRDLIQTIVLGVLRNIRILDSAYEKLVYKPQKLAPSVRIILRMALFQKLFLDKIPDFAIVNEHVQLTKKYGNRGAVSLVNAVLRKSLSLTINDVVLAHDGDDLEKMAVRYSHPDWMIKKWAEFLSPERLQQVLKANNTPAPLFLLGFEDAQQTLESFVEKGILSRFPHQAHSYQLLSKISDIEVIIDSGAIIQDVHSQWASTQLGVQPGEKILDVCSGRGGKTISMLADAKGHPFGPHKIQVTALDLKSGKLVDFRKRLLAMNSGQDCESISLTVWNVLSDNPRLSHLFDRVFCDMPCSNSGVIRRHPEIRRRLTPRDSVRLANKQKRILKRVAEYVKKGGELLYAVCTFEPEETNQVIQNFLKKDNRFKPIACKPPRYEECDYDLSPEGFVTLYPTINGGDGFFVAKIKRTR